MRDDRRVIVALDMADSAAALKLADQLDPALCRVKVGKELFIAAGPAVVEALMQRGFDVFLDLKLHDIPHTVEKAVASAARLGVWMLTVHAAGGLEMMQAARRACRPGASPLLVAVTVLTSMTADALPEVGVQDDAFDQVQRLAVLAQRAAMDGVVCSAHEARTLRQLLGEDFLLVTPGIRPAGDPGHDQKRVATPAEALRNGSSYLVVGRSITDAPDPRHKLAQISNQLA